MKNSVLKFFTVTQQDQNLVRTGETLNSITLPLYDTYKIKKIFEIIDGLSDEYFGYTSLKNNVTIEKMSYDIYQSPDYWDVLIIVNYKNPLFSMPYDFDIVYDSVEDYINNYEEKVIKRSLTENERERLRKTFMERASIENEENRLLRYIYPEKIYDFLQILRENDVL